MPRSYNSYVNMAYGGHNLLTRVIDAVREHGLSEFTPYEVCDLLNEGGETPGQTVKACITCNAEGYSRLERPAFFVRVRKGVYRLANR